MIQGSLARRYARALVEIAQETGAFEELGRDLLTFAELISKDKHLREALISPMLKKDAKDEIIKELCARVSLSNVITSFLRLLNEKGRMDYLERIASAYQEMQDEAEARVRAEVRSPTRLGVHEADQVRKALSRVSKKEVIMEVKEDPSLIGGILVRIGGILLDGTLKSQLRRIKEEMSK
jgi:F-type H+-transporting ATPase subunit delta